MRFIDRSGDQSVSLRQHFVDNVIDIIVFFPIMYHIRSKYDDFVAKSYWFTRNVGVFRAGLTADLLNFWVSRHFMDFFMFRVVLRGIIWIDETTWFCFEPLFWHFRGNQLFCLSCHRPTTLLRITDRCILNVCVSMDRVHRVRASDCFLSTFRGFVSKCYLLI